MSHLLGPCLCQRKPCVQKTGPFEAQGKPELQEPDYSSSFWTLVTKFLTYERRFSSSFSRTMIALRSLSLAFASIAASHWRAVSWSFASTSLSFSCKFFSSSCRRDFSDAKSPPDACASSYE